MARPPPTNSSPKSPSASANQDPVVTLPKKLATGLETSSPGSGLGKSIFLLDRRTSYTLTDLASQIRQAPDDQSRIRILTRVSPDASNALSSLVRTAKTKLTLTAYSPDGQVDPQAQHILENLVEHLFNSSDYTEGFNNRQSLDGLVETLLRETPMTGGTALELVLDKQRLPYYVQPVSPSTIKWATSPTKQISATGLPLAFKPIPYQLIMGVFSYLDVPNFFYSTIDQDPTSAYSSSMFESAIMPALLHEDLIRDIHRVVRQTGHSRLYVKLIFEKMKEAMPQDVRSDPEKWEPWFEAQRSQIESVIANLAPEQGFALYDTAEAGYVGSTIGAGSDYTGLVDVLDGRISASLKVPPAVLSKRMAAGSQNTSSTEALLHLVTAEAIQQPTCTVLSRMFTLAVRLLGVEASVKASFDKPNLRPDLELSAFRSMYQTNVLTLLSLGFLTDQEAAQLLGTGPLSPDAQPLSGTRFMSANGSGSLSDPTSNADPIKRAVTGNLPADTPSKPVKTGASR